MKVSLSGLDLSFLKDPAKRLPPRQRKERINHAAKRSDTVAAPYFMADITPFIGVATTDREEISSRAQLREYENKHGIKQCGDYKPGEITGENNKRLEEIRKDALPVEWV